MSETRPESAAATGAAQAVDDGAAAKLARQVTNPLLIRAYLLLKMPLAFFAGLRVRSLDAERCETTVPYGWRSTNPFGSTYFAALTMAAELSAGTLAMLAVRQAPARVGMLIVGLDARFENRARAKTTFTCEEGHKLFAAVRETLRTGEQVRTQVETVGRLPDGTEVARITFYWSFKKRAPR